MSRGPKPDQKADLKVLELRLKGKSFRQIADVIGNTVSIAHRRYARAVRGLSTGRGSGVRK